jgi:glyoxylase-like metal-dependent hydrolase (beta-lactamase superfamily II)
MILERVVVGSLEVNCYILASEPGKKALIIDPGGDEDKVFAALEKRKLEPGLVVNTHGHYDHIGCDDSFGVDVCVHEKDAPMLRDPRLNLSVLLGDFYKVRSRTRLLEEGQEVELDGIRLAVIHTPGHSAGSICLRLVLPEEAVLFSGDTLFCQGVGRADLGGGDERQLMESIRKKLLCLPPETVVYPGHGPSTTIGREKAGNPFLV